jgi:hypothetical protein
VSVGANGACAWRRTGVAGGFDASGTAALLAALRESPSDARVASAESAPCCPPPLRRNIRNKAFSRGANQKPIFMSADSMPTT